MSLNTSDKCFGILGTAITHNSMVKWFSDRALCHQQAD